MIPNHEDSARERVRTLCERFVAGESDDEAVQNDDDDPQWRRGPFVSTGRARDGTLRHARARSLARRSQQPL